MVDYDFPSPRETQPNSIFCQLEMHAVLNEAMKPLPSREQQVVKAYYSEDKTMKEIGDRLGISETRVSQLHKSALDRMQAELRASGFHSFGAFYA